MRRQRIESRFTIHESRSPALRCLQRGLTILGALFVIAILAVGGYFGYQWYTGGEDLPTCKNDHTACMRMCRRLTTDSAEAQKCQDGCERDMAACERKIGGN